MSTAKRQTWAEVLNPSPAALTLLAVITASPDPVGQANALTACRIARDSAIDPGEVAVTWLAPVHIVDGEVPEVGLTHVAEVALYIDLAGAAVGAVHVALGDPSLQADALLAAGAGGVSETAAARPALIALPPCRLGLAHALTRVPGEGGTGLLLVLFTTAVDVNVCFLILFLSLMVNSAKGTHTLLTGME